MRCAIEVQNGLIERNAGVPTDRRIEFRVGVHLGDVVEESDGDLMGDGVNIAARLEGIAKPGAICLSEDAYRQVKGRLDLAASDLGETQLKNIAEPIEFIRSTSGERAPAKPAPPSPRQTRPAASFDRRSSLRQYRGRSGAGLFRRRRHREPDNRPLANERDAFVIGRNTAFTYKDKAADLKQIGRELNVRYVLEGSVQRGANRIRVNVQLIDAETGNHLWAERFDKPVADLFDMQDEIVARLANALNAQLITAEARRSERVPSPNSIDLYFQGMSAYNRGPTRDRLSEARRLFERALALDPENVDAIVGAARTESAFAWSHMSDDRAAHMAAAEARRKALSIAPEKAAGHVCLGIVRIYTNRVAQGIAELERALAIDRNLADAHAYIGIAKCFVGRAEETEIHVRDALRLSPRDTLRATLVDLFGCRKSLSWQGRSAIAQLRHAIEINRSFRPPPISISRPHWRGSEPSSTKRGSWRRTGFP